MAERKANAGGREDVSGATVPKEAGSTRRLAILLAMAMFVLVVDTSLMNVSIAAVVNDLDTTVSGVQSAIALEALVSAAFILIGSKVGDLIGRKRAYVLGLLGLRDRCAGDGARSEPDRGHHLLGDHRWTRRIAAAAGDAVPDPRQLRGSGADRRPTRWSGRPPRSPPRSDRCSEGFITTYLSWRVAFLLEDVVILIVLSGIRLVRDVALHRTASVDLVGAGLSVVGMGGSCSASWCGRKGARPSPANGDRRARDGRGCSTGWSAASARASRRCWTRICSSRPDSDSGSRSRCSSRSRLGGTHDRAADLPADRARVQRDASRASRSRRCRSAMFGIALLAGKKAGTRRPSSIIRLGFALLTAGMAVLIPIVPRAELRLVPRRPADDRGIGVGIAGLAAQQLHAVADLGGAGQRGRRRELGGRIIRALVRAGVRRRDHARHALVRFHQHGRRRAPCCPPPSSSRSPTRSRMTREVMSNTQLEEQLAGQPAAT